jgi:hypothetical protein
MLPVQRPTRTETGPSMALSGPGQDLFDPLARHACLAFLGGQVVDLVGRRRIDEPAHDGASHARIAPAGCVRQVQHDALSRAASAMAASNAAMVPLSPSESLKRMIRSPPASVIVTGGRSGRVGIEIGQAQPALRAVADGS